jgi:hypothetical protein
MDFRTIGLKRHGRGGKAISSPQFEKGMTANLLRMGDGNLGVEHQDREALEPDHLSESVITSAR